MKLYTHEEMLDKVLGKEGEPLRDKYEADINSYLMGETIKKARKAKKLSQEQLGELMGVTKSQVSRIENGKNLSLELLQECSVQWELAQASIWVATAKLPYGNIRYNTRHYQPLRHVVPTW